MKEEEVVEEREARRNEEYMIQNMILWSMRILWRISWNIRILWSMRILWRILWSIRILWSMRISMEYEDIYRI